MKAVILAAGQGIRMRPLTLTRPKPLLDLAGKPLLERIVSALPLQIDELILVIGYKGNQIKKFLGKNYRGRKIIYVWQKEMLGTGHALKLCQSHLDSERFLLLYADDIHGARGLKNVLRYNLALMVAESKNPSRFGVVLINKEGKITSIQEKPKVPKSNLVFTGAGVLDNKIFNYSTQQSSTGEYYLTEMINQLIQKNDVFAQLSSSWVPIGNPEELKRAIKNV